MKRILICSAGLFFGSDRDERNRDVGEAMVAAAQKAGARAEYLFLPFDPEASVIEQFITLGMVELGAYDAVLGIGYPCHVLNHPALTVWLHVDKSDPSLYQQLTRSAAVARANIARLQSLHGLYLGLAGKPGTYPADARQLLDWLDEHAIDRHLATVPANLANIKPKTFAPLATVI